ncbi:low specificity L-threonine aldolase [Chakrabartia godavariana]|nr:low specificity L-threonine aldolase [Chakrabartia godavariana]
MRFFSDNAASVHPAVLEAMAACNRVDTAYDGDAISTSLDTVMSDLFETDVTALWVATGTAANSLALASLCPPYGSVLCHRDAHIQNDECGAPEFYTHGAKLALIDGDGAKVTADALKAKLAATPGGVHWAQPHALSITNATEYGRVYAPDEVAALGEIAKAQGLGFHMDGARFANAIVTLGCAPADVTWRAGIDVLSFGFTKNGGMSAECLVYFDRDKAKGVAERRKRAGHLLSKGRYMAAQIVALLQDDVWLDNARAANAGAQTLGAACGARLFQPVEANEVFARMTPDEAARLRAQGFDFYDWAEGEVRFVVSWDQPAAEIEAFAAAIAAL